jgi:hypothetical protein
MLDDIKIRKDGLFDGIDDPILNERYGKKALWIDKFLHNKLQKISKTKNKNPQAIAEYLISLGISTVENYNMPTEITFDIDKL